MRTAIPLTAPFEHTIFIISYFLKKCNRFILIDIKNMAYLTCEVVDFSARVCYNQPDADNAVTVTGIIVLARIVVEAPAATALHPKHFSAADTVYEKEISLRWLRSMETAYAERTGKFTKRSIALTAA